MADFKQTHGNVNSGVATERAPKEGDVPMGPCTDNCPSGEHTDRGPGPGIRGNTRRIG